MTAARAARLDPAKGNLYMRICLAASGGGHLRQLLDLQPFWQKHDYFFVTEDIALGRSVASDHRTHFVAHVALGQARLGKPAAMVAAAFRNAWQSIRIVLRERPDVVLTTGAGSVFWTVLFSRVLGAKVVVIDSFARFEGRSAFAKIAGPLAHLRVAQSAAVHREWRGSHLFDPFRHLPVPDRRRDALAFVTVGATLPFDRLVTLTAYARERGELAEDIVLQVGVGGVKPANIASVETLPFSEVQSVLERADLVLCHGGTGSLITALRQGCRVVAVPRRFELGEHYDDHQVEIVKAFVARGLIQTADTPEEMTQALQRARAMAPVAATTDATPLIAFLRNALEPQRADSG
jgi:UDP-N-acetylglucosamine transferase subunit ALG13